MSVVAESFKKKRRAGEIVIGIWQLSRAGPAPKGLINRPIAAKRRIVLTVVPLDQVKRIRCCFVQAEDGIRLLYVTGVQTCALPICSRETLADSSSVRPGASPSQKGIEGG